jgi:hypothetical protein
VDLFRVVLLIATTVGLGLVIFSVVASVRWPHVQHGSSTSVKVFGLELSTGGALGIGVLGLALIIIALLFWNKGPPEIPWLPDSTHPPNPPIASPAAPPSAPPAPASNEPQPTPATHVTPEAAVPPSSEPHVASNPLDFKILVNCEPSSMPTVMPATGVLNTLPLGYPGGKLESVGQQTSLSTPGDPLQLLPEQKHLVLKCTVYNYTNEAIFNFKTNLKIEEFESVVSANNPKQGITDGRLISSIEWPLNVDKLGPTSPENTYDLYIWNGGDNILRVWSPLDAIMQRAGDRNMVPAKLQPPQFAARSLGPGRDPRKH